MKRDRTKFLYAPMLQKGIDANTGKLVVRYSFTSDNMDTSGDIITREATEKATEAWREWRNIRMQHDPGRPIGKAIGIGEKDDLDWNVMDVRIDDSTVLPLVEGDDPVLSGASVGIIVNDFEVSEDPDAIALAWWEPWIITDYTMVEISLVDHPANYDAKRVSESTVEGKRSRVMFMQRDLPDQKQEAPSLEQEEKMPEKTEAIEEVSPEKELVTETEKDIEVESVPEETEPEGVEVTPEEVKQEGGDPVLELLSQMNEKLDSLTTLTDAGFKSMTVKEVEVVEAEEEEVAPVEVENAVEEPEKLEEDEPLDKGLLSEETESEEIQETESEDLEEKFKQMFDAMFSEKLDELKKLKARVSQVVEPDAIEDEEEAKSKPTLNAKERLRSGIRELYENKE